MSITPHFNTFLRSIHFSTLRSVLSVVVLLTTFWSSGQFLGVPQMTHYPVDQHGAGGQNYQVKVSQDGIVYVANNFGLLRFDGSEWKRFEIPGGTKLRSIHLAEDGRIFIGAQNELGYFQADERGSLQYRSLKDRLPESHQSFEDVWKILAQNQQLVFVTTGTSFILSDDSFNALESSSTSGYAALYGDTLVTQDPGGEIVKYTGGRWKPFTVQPILKQESLVTTIQMRESSHLWLTRNNGIRWTQGNKISVFAEEYTEVLSEASITTALLLKSGEIAVGTQSSGLFIFSSRGDLLYHFDKNKGLNSLTVNDLTQDQNGAVWVALNNSIVKIHWSYPFSFIDDKLNLPGTGYSAASFKEHLYFGTNNGLYRSSSVNGTLTTTEKVGSLNGQINNVQLVEDDLIISADGGIFNLDEDGTDPIDQSVGWWGLVTTDKPGLVFGGAYDGVGLFEHKRGRWSLKKKFQGFGESSRVMSMDQGYLWIAHGYKGIYRLKFSDQYDSLLQVKYYGVEEGLPSLYLNNVFKVSNELIFGTESGLFQFDYSKELFVRHPYFDTLIGPDVHTRAIKENARGDIYFLTNSYCGILIKDQWKGYRLEKNLFNSVFPLLNNDLSQISVLRDDEVLLTANKGFIHFQAREKEVTQNPIVKLTSVQLTNSGEYLKGFYTGADFDQGLDALDYSNNSLSFTYTSLQDQFDQPLYAYRLIGFKDEQWSEWSTQNSKEYTNLYEGAYTFEVKSKDVFNNESAAVAFGFQISPPWFRSTIAYIGYIFLFVSTFFISFYSYRRKYKKEKSRLIEVQEKEIKIKDSELTQLRNEKLESEISHKKRQLASSTMHLLDKNDLLTKLKTQIHSLSDSENLDQPTKKELRRMVKEIDRNIDKDKSWEQFELHFDEVHGDFLKRISHEFDNMTPQEIKLAAYLRMNMTTKEIANLLKISVRGVEIARYRLRKKLNLNQGQNLVDFMLKY